MKRNLIHSSIGIIFLFSFFTCSLCAINPSESRLKHLNFYDIFNSLCCLDDPVFYNRVLSTQNQDSYVQNEELNEPNRSIVIKFETRSWDAFFLVRYCKKFSGNVVHHKVMRKEPSSHQNVFEKIQKSFDNDDFISIIYSVLMILSMIYLSTTDASKTTIKIENMDPSLFEKKLKKIDYMKNFYKIWMKFNILNLALNPKRTSNERTIESRNSIVRLAFYAVLMKSINHFQTNSINDILKNWVFAFLIVRLLNWLSYDIVKIWIGMMKERRYLNYILVLCYVFFERKTSKIMIKSIPVFFVIEILVMPLAEFFLNLVLCSLIKLNGNWVILQNFISQEFFEMSLRSDHTNEQKNARKNRNLMEIYKKQNNYYNNINKIMKDCKQMRPLQNNIDHSLEYNFISNPKKFRKLKFSQMEVSDKYKLLITIQDRDLLIYKYVKSRLRLIKKIATFQSLKSIIIIEDADMIIAHSYYCLYFINLKTLKKLDYEYPSVNAIRGATWLRDLKRLFIYECYSNNYLLDLNGFIERRIEVPRSNNRRIKKDIDLLSVFHLRDNLILCQQTDSNHKMECYRISDDNIMHKLFEIKGLGSPYMTYLYDMGNFYLIFCNQLACTLDLENLHIRTLVLKK